MQYPISAVIDSSRLSSYTVFLLQYMCVYVRIYYFRQSAARVHVSLHICSNAPPENTFHYELNNTLTTVILPYINIIVHVANKRLILWHKLLRRKWHFIKESFCLISRVYYSRIRLNCLSESTKSTVSFKSKNWSNMTQRFS